MMLAASSAPHYCGVLVGCHGVVYKLTTPLPLPIIHQPPVLFNNNQVLDLWYIIVYQYIRIQYTTVQFSKLEEALDIQKSFPNNPHQWVSATEHTVLVQG